MRDSKTVFYVSASLVAFFVVLGAVFPQRLEAVFVGGRDYITMNLGWFYVVSVGLFLLFTLALFLSPYGRIRLGKDDEEPEFSTLTWFAMLFSAGMGIGLLFWSVAEPIYHFQDPPRAVSGSVAIAEIRELTPQLASLQQQAAEAEAAHGDVPEELQEQIDGVKGQLRQATVTAADAGREAITMTFFHWGLHAWGIYIVVGLSLAYFSFRKGLPLTIRSTLWPLLGRRVNGPIGQTVEVIAICGTVFGVATSLGLGVKQIAGGMEFLGWIDTLAGADGQAPPWRWAHLFLIGGITAIATISVVSGLEVGIRRLSELNMWLGLALLVFVAVAGPIVFLFGTLIQGIGNYMSSLVELTFRTESLRAITAVDGALEREKTWAEGWTIFYWAWWISWSPFVGMFIARVSRGRTIRGFITGVLLVPTLFTFAWLVIFGGSAIHQELADAHSLPAAAHTEVVPDMPAPPVERAPGIVEADPDLAVSETAGAGIIGSSTELALFAMLANLPWSSITSILAMLVIATYFVTSSDSASLVVDILSHNGDTNPPIPSRVFWALTEGAVAAVLLVAGGLDALQAGAIIMALPICLVMVLMCWSLFLALQREFTRIRTAEDRQVTEVLAAATGGDVDDLPESSIESIPWRDRLRRIVTDSEYEMPDKDRQRVDVKDIRQTVAGFMEETVIPAFRDIERELKKLGRTVTIEKRPYQTSLTVFHNGQEEFSYAVRGRAFHKLSFAFPEFGGGDEPRILKAEVVLPSGPQSGFKMTEFTRQGIIDDFLGEYAHWRGRDE